jgi:ribosomal protein S18 acetylase RimI-like enzyme
MNISLLNDSLLDEALAFVTRLNQESVHHISYFSESSAEIEADFAAIQPPGGYSYLALSDQGKLLGFFGVEIDKELGRCWLFGPLVDHPDWHLVAGTLYDAILADLPGEIVDQEIFCGKENIRVREFAENQGFADYTEGAVLTLDIRQHEYVPTSNVAGFNGDFISDLNALHEELFPNTYYSARQLVDLTEDPDKRLFVSVRGGELVGYVFIQARQAFKDGYIDFLGVGEAFRHQGIGSHLVNAALNWVQTFPFVEKATLTVRTDNVPALGMYAGLGFQVESVSQAFRKRP